jgi:hypothetical protein
LYLRGEIIAFKSGKSMHWVPAQFGQCLSHQFGYGCRLSATNNTVPRQHQWHRFDVGAYAHIIFVQDQLDALAEEGFRSVQNASSAVRRMVAAGVAAIEARPDFRIGMTIVVFGGLGRGFQADPGQLPPHWRFVGLGCEDFELFSRDSNTSALQMYRLLDQEHKLLSDRTQLYNPNGFLNLYGFTKQNNFEMLPD